MLLHSYRMFPSKTLLFSQKLSIRYIGWTHNSVTYLSLVPCMAVFQLRLHVSFPGEQEPFLARLHAMLGEFPTTQRPQLTAAAFVFLSFHFY